MIVESKFMCKIHISEDFLLLNEYLFLIVKFLVMLVLYNLKLEIFMFLGNFLFHKVND